MAIASLLWGLRPLIVDVANRGGTETAFSSERDDNKDVVTLPRIWPASEIAKIAALTGCGRS